MKGIKYYDMLDRVLEDLSKRDIDIAYNKEKTHKAFGVFDFYLEIYLHGQLCYKCRIEDANEEHVENRCKLAMFELFLCGVKFVGDRDKSFL